jgi:uncharacterized protein YndB with AHSA1/START domain
MAPVIATADVNRPAADVFAYATDPARFSEWQRASSPGAWTTPDPHDRETGA